ncbi:MAG: hypothetical protein ABFC84_03270 [Veillonellales bacterium]
MSRSWRLPAGGFYYPAVPLAKTKPANKKSPVFATVYRVEDEG